jgi:hypothetical protein
MSGQRTSNYANRAVQVEDLPPETRAERSRNIRDKALGAGLRVSYAAGHGLVWGTLAATMTQSPVVGIGAGIAGLAGNLVQSHSFYVRGRDHAMRDAVADKRFNDRVQDMRRDLMTSRGRGQERRGERARPRGAEDRSR